MKDIEELFEEALDEVNRKVKLINSLQKILTNNKEDILNELKNYEIDLTKFHISNEGTAYFFLNTNNKRKNIRISTHDTTSKNKKSTILKNMVFLYGDN